LNLRFLSLEKYSELNKDSIKQDKPKLTEDIELTKIFREKYSNQITEHCVNTKFYDQDSISHISYCSEKTKIKLIEKKANFYIFKIDAFEIDDFFLFNIDNEVVYTTNNYPQILDNGKIVIDVEYGNQNSINYYIFEKDKLKYFEFKGPFSYNLKNIKLLKSFNSNPKVIGDFIRYDYKEVPNKEGFGKKYDYDREKYCRKALMIF
jgi:hypothetical protein